MNKILIAGLIVLGSMGIAGNAAATCQSGAAGAGFYSVCVLESYNFACCGGYQYSSDTPVSAYAYQGPLYASAGTNQYAGQYAGFYSFSGTSAYAYSPAGGASLYQSAFSSGGYNYQSTGASAGVPFVYASAGQYAYNGACFMYAYGPFGGTTQPCGAVPILPQIPQL